MTADMSCEQLRELAPELALGILAGEERDAALRHLSGCQECRRLVSELSSVGEELLLLAPAHEPPVGFESRVLDRLIEPATPPRLASAPRRKRWVTAMAVAAAVVLAAALGGGSAFLAGAGDRRLADSIRTVLSEGQGSFFAAAPLGGPNGRVGTVFGYQGRPSWIMVTVQPPIGEQRSFEVRVVTRDGRYLGVGSAVLGGEVQVWGHQIPVDLSAVREVRFVGSDGRIAFTAIFGAANPWD